MRKHKHNFFIFITCACISFHSYAQEKCIGWATVDGEITGGQGGTVVTVSTAADFISNVKDGSNKIVRVKGKISFDRRVAMEEVRGLTIEGAEPGAEIDAQFFIENCSNIIFRNLIFAPTKIMNSDIITMEEGTHHVWIDHCDFYDKRPKLDGIVDMTIGCDNITISWNKFHYPDSTIAHRFAMLISSSDGSGGDDRGKERVTIHHNWWAENIEERMPRARFGKIHVFNNYYNSIGNNYCIGPGVEAQVVVESNYFENVKDPHIFYNEEPTAQIRLNNDNYYTADVTGKRDNGQGSSFVIPYEYSLDRGVDVKQIVMAGAGPFGKPVKTIQNFTPVKRANSDVLQKQLNHRYTLHGAVITEKTVPSIMPTINRNEEPTLVLPVKK